MADDPAPTPNESTGAMLDAYTKYLPDLLKINADNFIPTAKAELAASEAVSPGYTALQQRLYDTYGPLLAETSNKINAQQQKAQAASDLEVLQGPGKELIQKQIEQQRLVDPEYYKAREQMGGRLGDLLGSINLNGKLSRGEVSELDRAQARENQNRGIASNPSQTAALQNALTFGNAQRGRELENKNLLGQALNTGNSFLSTAQSGQDAFQIGTGRSSMPNAGDSKFLGANQNAASGAQNTQGQLLGQVGNFTQQQNDINSKRRDELDRFNQTFSSVVGSV